MARRRTVSTRAPRKGTSTAANSANADIDLGARLRRLGQVKADERLGVVEGKTVVGDQAASTVARAGDTAGTRFVDGARTVKDKTRSPRLLDRLPLDQHPLGHEVLVRFFHP